MVLFHSLAKPPFSYHKQFVERWLRLSVKNQANYLTFNWTQPSFARVHHEKPPEAFAQAAFFVQTSTQTRAYDLGDSYKSARRGART